MFDFYEHVKLIHSSPKISAYQFVSGMMHPMQKQPNPNAAIEGPPRRIEELESDKEDWCFFFLINIDSPYSPINLFVS